MFASARLRTSASKGARCLRGCSKSRHDERVPGNANTVGDIVSVRSEPIHAWVWDLKIQSAQGKVLIRFGLGGIDLNLGLVSGRWTPRRFPRNTRYCVSSSLLLTDDVYRAAYMREVDESQMHQGNADASVRIPPRRLHDYSTNSQLTGTPGSELEVEPRFEAPPFSCGRWKDRLLCGNARRLYFAGAGTSNVQR
ncbi:hypothetical protein B0H17DRAFT_1129167 [Mycena rosella]|uniref:Uncharacterized protein n=1 Tax=Mycena rosella TaxID=1033263 RepID=A0AAD7GKN2_MYCRO|nr:hypothetical protein B0H17DRAFT_1129167 [Mycena rosella]